MNKCGIYKITSPTNKIYIGQSYNIYKRWKCYRNFKAKTQVCLGRSFIKYGVDSHIFETIHELPLDVSQEVMNNYERFYWQQYIACGFVSLNAREPGLGRLFPQTKEKLRKINTGKKHTLETKIKLRNIKRENPNSQDVIQKMINTKKSWSI